MSNSQKTHNSLFDRCASVTQERAEQLVYAFGRTADNTHLPMTQAEQHAAMSGLLRHIGRAAEDLYMVDHGDIAKRIFHVCRRDAQDHADLIDFIDRREQFLDARYAPGLSA